jgi:hypothetical protein
MTIEDVYRLVTMGSDGPEVMWMPLDVLVSMFNRIDSPRKDISDFILECAKAGLPGSTSVLLTRDSISVVVD